MPAHSSDRPAQQIRRLHRRAQALAIAGILSTALLAGLATALPFYYASRDSIESISRLSIEAHADALHHQLGRFQDVASQFTSRTEIRRRLEAYAAGRVSLEEVSRYTQPRMADAMRQASDVAGLIRLGPESEVVTSIGTVPAGVSFEPSDREGSGYPCQFHELDDGTLLVQACAPIHDAQGERIGTDLVFFHATPLIDLLSNTERVGKDAAMRLHESEGQRQLAIQDSQAALLPIGNASQPTSQRQTSFLLPMGSHGWQLEVDIPSRRLQGAALELIMWPILAMLLLTAAGTALVSRALRPLLARVDEQAQLLHRSTQQLNQAASVFRHAREAIVITDQAHSIVEVNPAFTELTGHAADSLAGTPLIELLEKSSGLEDAIERVRLKLEQADAWEGEVRYRCTNGDTLVALQTISAVRDADGKLVRHIHIFNDITAQKAAEEAVLHQALHDELTGLANRTHLDQSLVRAIRKAHQHARQLAVLFLDLDHFKEVNDTLGHQAGDDLLKQVASRLAERLREQDLLARLGGDEFVIVLEDIRRAQHAGKIADGIVQALLEPFTVAGEVVQIGVSVGVALYPEDGHTAQTLIDSADAAMYRAKDAGRNTWRLYDRALDEALSGSAPR
jgi:diguanylate cyclase (GGDEF)-like protein/PAS domain S-box-containing protein